MLSVLFLSSGIGLAMYFSGVATPLGSLFYLLYSYLIFIGIKILKNSKKNIKSKILPTSTIAGSTVTLYSIGPKTHKFKQIFNEEDGNDYNEYIPLQEEISDFFGISNQVFRPMLINLQLNHIKEIIVENMDFLNLIKNSNTNYYNCEIFKENFSNYLNNNYEFFKNIPKYVFNFMNFNNTYENIQAIFQLFDKLFIEKYIDIIRNMNDNELTLEFNIITELEYKYINNDINSLLDKINLFKEMYIEFPNEVNKNIHEFNNIKNINIFERYNNIDFQNFNMELEINEFFKNSLQLNDDSLLAINILYDNFKTNILNTNGLIEGISIIITNRTNFLETTLKKNIEKNF